MTMLPLFFLFLPACALSSSLHPTLPDPALSGRLMGLADVNHDQNMDLLLSTEDGKSLNVYLSTTAGVGQKRTFSKVSNEIKVGGQIVDVISSDFNADSFLDLLISYTVEDAVKVTVRYSDDKGNFDDLGGSELTLGHANARPTIIDCNMDGIGDVLVVQDKKRLCYYGSTDKHDLLNASSAKPFAADGADAEVLLDVSVAFVDLDHDLSPEVVFRVKTEKNIPKFEVWSWAPAVKKWKKKDDQFMRQPEVGESANGKLLASSDGKPGLFSQSVFADFDGDGWNDHLILECRGDKGCGGAMDIILYIWSSKTRDWNPMNLDLGNSNLQLVPDPKGDLGSITLRAGDITENGYVDLMGVFKNGSHAIPLLIRNVPGCSGDTPCDYTQTFKRRFEVISLVKTPVPKGINQTQIATLVDVDEDGTYDLLLENTEGGKSVTHAFPIDKSSVGGGSDDQGELSGVSANDGDTCFVKIQIYTGTCGASDCKNGGSTGSAVPLHGACVTVRGSNLDGSSRYGSACQMPVSSHRSLQSPSILLGLGRSPNFLDELSVGVPFETMANHTFKQIIPNSRVYIVPHPVSKPNSWTIRLFVTPSRLILLSFAALSIVCALIILIILGLHCAERLQDRKEREAQRLRYTFDAM